MTQIIINKNSGTVLRLGQEAVEKLLRDHLYERIERIDFLEGKDMCPALHELKDERDIEVLVGGGDGSAVCAAETLGPAKVPFGILPLGTMNLLAQDLGAAPTFEETIAKFDRLVRDDIDAGYVNGHIFLCSAVVGFVPEGAVAREALRENTGIATIANFIGTIARGMGGEIKQVLNLKSRHADKPYPIETTSLIISNNSFIQKPADATQRFMRESLHDGKLAVYSAAPRDMMDGLKMALSLWQGDWQDHESVRSFEVTELIVETEENKILVSLDGEPLDMQSPLHFTIKPKSVPVLRMELKH
jgi:diacylglycerol kinase family enzyme